MLSNGPLFKFGKTEKFFDVINAKFNSSGKYKSFPPANYSLETF